MNNFMLIITRRAGEAFVISDQIRVQVVRVSGTRVQLAVAAPDCVSIHRGEVYHERREQEIQRRVELLTVPVPTST